MKIEDLNKCVVSPFELAIDADMPLPTVHSILREKGSPDPILTKGRFSFWLRGPALAYLKSRKKGRAA